MEYKQLPIKDYVDTIKGLLSQVYFFDDSIQEGFEDHLLEMWLDIGFWLQVRNKIQYKDGKYEKSA